MVEIFVLVLLSMLIGGVLVQQNGMKGLAIGTAGIIVLIVLRIMPNLILVAFGVFFFAVLCFLFIGLRNKFHKKNDIFDHTDLSKKHYVIGTKRERTKLDDVLDKVVLDKYYASHNERRSPEKNKVILKRSYLTEIKS